MFIRWKIAKSKKWRATHSAYLVQSERINGKPHQKIIAYLGHVHMNETNTPPIMDAASFLDHCEQTLSTVPGADVQALMREIENHVPRPDANELAETRKQFEAWKKQLKSIFQP